MTPALHQLVIAARERFVRAGIPPDQAAIDAEVLARHVLGWDRATYLTRRGEPLAADFAGRLDRLVSRRELREPVAYITGAREFWGREFVVTSAVLIPRPETEFIVEHALRRLPDRARGWHVADVGTGSGCLAVTLAAELPCAVVVATDSSADALAIAARNAVRHGVADRVRLAHDSLLDHQPGPFDLIVANLPYIPRSVEGSLMTDVRAFEPAGALYGSGEDGLDEIRALVAQAGARLSAEGTLLLEFGSGQGDAIAALIAARPDLILLDILRDLQGHQRTAAIRRAARRG